MPSIASQNMYCRKNVFSKSISVFNFQKIIYHTHNPTFIPSIIECVYYLRYVSFTSCSSRHLLLPLNGSIQNHHISSFAATFIIRGIR